MLLTRNDVGSSALMLMTTKKDSDQLTSFGYEVLSDFSRDREDGDN